MIQANWVKPITSVETSSFNLLAFFAKVPSSLDIQVIPHHFNSLFSLKFTAYQRYVFMNGTLNVVTGFALGKQYDFDDPDFIKLASFVRIFFENMAYIYISKVWYQNKNGKFSKFRAWHFWYRLEVITYLIPRWVLQLRAFRAIRYYTRRSFILERIFKIFFQALLD